MLAQLDISDLTVHNAGIATIQAAMKFAAAVEFFLDGQIGRINLHGTDEIAAALGLVRGFVVCEICLPHKFLRSFLYFIPLKPVDRSFVDGAPIEG
jgi:hypothetical protein